MADRVTNSIIVKAGVPDVYEVWSNFENFPHFMKHIESVTMTGDQTSHWVMKGLLGAKIEWDAVTTRMDKYQRIAWSSKDNSPLKTSGQVTFKELPHDETEVTVMLHYEPPAGIAGDVAAALFGNPVGRLDEDLRNFKT